MARNLHPLGEGNAIGHSIMKTFLRVIEVWVPSADGSLLEFGGGVFGAATTLLAMSRAMCFGRAEGLPGRVWESEQPVLLPRLEGSTYRRSAPAQAAGLGCAAAMPLFVNDALAAVVVFYGTADAQPAAAMELWGHDARITADLTLADGCYLGGAEALEGISRDSYLPRGVGLPGLAWQRGAAVFVDDVARSPDFLRGDEAAQAGLKRALAIPCAARGHEQHVLAFLGAGDFPIARRVESWAPGGGGAALQRHHAQTEGSAAFEPDAQSKSAIDSAFFSGLPAFVDAVALGGGTASLAAIPIAAEGTVSEVLAFYL
jgi:hypothetical protein